MLLLATTTMSFPLTKSPCAERGLLLISSCPLFCLLGRDLLRLESSSFSLVPKLLLVSFFWTFLNSKVGIFGRPRLMTPLLLELPKAKFPLPKLASSPLPNTLPLPSLILLSISLSCSLFILCPWCSLWYLASPSPSEGLSCRMLRDRLLPTLRVMVRPRGSRRGLGWA